MDTRIYSSSFYEQLRSGATRSAEVIVPLLQQFLAVGNVVDVGCGDGSWLAAFRKLGVDDVLGIDGAHVRTGVLQIPQESFRVVDLTKPFEVGRAFDLAISLEVAEHLPPECAEVFVDCLVRLAPCVLFSAAIPFQGGTHHVNEQWQDMWAELFKTRSYLPIDCIRNRVWENENVEWWYAQNTLLFVRSDLLQTSESLRAEFERGNHDQLRLVHPRLYLSRQPSTQTQQRLGVRAASRFLLVSVKEAVRSRLRRFRAAKDIPKSDETSVKVSDRNTIAGRGADDRTADHCLDHNV
jgi:SAM-dependent methyltransferase